MDIASWRREDVDDLAVLVDGSVYVAQLASMITSDGNRRQRLIPEMTHSDTLA
jgi:hypothetical protein